VSGGGRATIRHDGRSSATLSIRPRAALVLTIEVLRLRATRQTTERLPVRIAVIAVDMTIAIAVVAAKFAAAH
jgi:hypothetical protein